MSVVILEEKTWAEIRTEMEKGRTTIVIPLGSTEQHGPHLPLKTDSFIGKRLSYAVADRVDAFLAPTVKFGYSAHHMAFPGTITLRADTLERVIIDIVDSFIGHGFKRIILLPSHGGNFPSLKRAVSKITPPEDVSIIAFTDLQLLLMRMMETGGRYNLDPGSLGVHAGAWETSIMMFLEPDSVRTDMVATGFTGELTDIQQQILNGIEHVDRTGVIGDPVKANADIGQILLEEWLDLILAKIQRAEKKSKGLNS